MENTNDIIGLLEKKTYLSDTFTRQMDKVQKLYEKALICKGMITEYDNLSDEEFYSRLKTLGINSYITSQDYINIVELANQRKYYGPSYIRTEMDEFVTHMDDEDDIGRELIGVRFMVVCDGNDLDSHKRYTKDEIKELLDKKRVVILEKHEDIPSYKNEICPKYEEIFTNPNGLFIKRNGKYHSTMLSYVRKEITKDKLREIFAELLRILKEEVNILEMCTKAFTEKDYQKKIGALEE